MKRFRHGLPLLALAAVVASASGCGTTSSSSKRSPATTTTSGTTRSSLKVTTTPKYGAPSSAQPVQSGVVQVAYRYITIRPDTLRVKVGSTIRWTSYDPVTHDVTSQGGPERFASAPLKEGESFSVKVTKPGLIHYECTFHPASMNGTIEVVG